MRQVAPVALLREPKVDQDEVRVVVLALQEEVLGLQVPVHDVPLREVVQHVEERHDEVARVLLAIHRLLGDAIEELAPFDHLHHQVVLLRLVIEEVVERNDVRVVAEPQVLHLFQ